jgi:hypothetical protein
MPYMRVLASQVNGQRGDMSSDGTRGPHQRGHLHPVLPVEEEEEEEGEGVHIYGMVGKSLSRPPLSTPPPYKYSSSVRSGSRRRRRNSSERSCYAYLTYIALFGGGLFFSSSSEFPVRCHRIVSAASRGSIDQALIQNRMVV